MTACFCCCSWFKKPKPPLSASHPTFEEVALELSLSQALSLQQTHRAFVHASCYIYLILPQVTVICILSTLVPTKVVTEQKKDLLNCQPVRALKALRNHHLWLSSCRCRKAKGLAWATQGVSLLLSAGSFHCTRLLPRYPFLVDSAPLLRGQCRACDKHFINICLLRDAKQPREYKPPSLQGPSAWASYHLHQTNLHSVWAAHQMKKWHLSPLVTWM